MDDDDAVYRKTFGGIPAWSAAVPVEKPAAVAAPDHYTAGDIECKDAIRAALGPEGYQAWCMGNAMKYIWRYKRKGNPTQDLNKAKQFIEMEITDREGTE